MRRSVLIAWGSSFECTHYINDFWVHHHVYSVTQKAIWAEALKKSILNSTRYRHKILRTKLFVTAGWSPYRVIISYLGSLRGEISEKNTSTYTHLSVWPVSMVLWCPYKQYLTIYEASIDYSAPLSGLWTYSFDTSILRGAGLLYPLPVIITSL